MCVRFGRRIEHFVCSVWSWKTPLKHRYLWINLTVVVVQNAVRSPRTGFSGRGDLEDARDSRGRQGRFFELGKGI